MNSFSLSISNIRHICFWCRWSTITYIHAYIHKSMNTKNHGGKKQWNSVVLSMCYGLTKVWAFKGALLLFDVTVVVIVDDSVFFGLFIATSFAAVLLFIVVLLVLFIVLVRDDKGARTITLLLLLLVLLLTVLFNTLLLLPTSKNKNKSNI